MERGRVRLRIDEERGGRLSSFQIDGSELLVGPSNAAERSIRWGCFLMAPWVGRIEHGILDWGGSRHRLRLTEGRHALHGLVFDRAWRVEAATTSHATLECGIGPPDWPAEATVRERFVLAEDHLLAEAEIEAAGPMPAALGWHPWFRRPDSGKGDVRVRLSAAEVLEAPDLIPTGRRIPVDAETDLREGPELGRRRLDHVFPDVRSPATIAWPTVRLLIEWMEPIHTIVVHTTPTSFCVEPQTAWPNAPSLVARGVTGTGLASLPAGGSLAATMRWRWSWPVAAPSVHGRELAESSGSHP